MIRHGRIFCCCRCYSYPCCVPQATHLFSGKTRRVVSADRSTIQLAQHNDSTTQYFYLLTSLDAAVAERMAGDVSLTPAVGKYEYLKSKLMGVYGLTEDQKADRLLDLPGLGDWTPSQFCAYIQGLAVDRNSLFRRFFLRQLPEDVRVQLAALGEDNLPELARKADIIMAAKHAQPVINASNHLPRKHSPARRSPKDTICWYHAKFGNKAKACRPPCLFSSSAKHCLSNSGNDQAST